MSKLQTWEWGGAPHSFDGTTVRAHFASMGALVDAVEWAPLAVGAHNHARKEDRPQDWDLGVGFGGAARLAREGWPEGAALATRAAAAILRDVAARVVKHDPVWREEGEAFDVGTLLSGEPEHWLSWDEVAGMAPTRRAIQLVINTGVSGSVASADIVRRGAAILTLTEAARLAGIEIEIVSLCLSKPPGGEAGVCGSCAVTLRKAGEPIDIDRLAFALVHPAWMRRLSYLGWVDGVTGPGTEKMRKAISSGYGAPMPASPTEWPGAIITPEMHSGDGTGPWSSDGGAEKWVLETLRAQGVELTPEGA